MEDTTEPIDIFAGAVDAIAKKLLYEVVVKAVVKAITTAIPLLGWGPIGFIVSWIVGKIADIIWKEVSLMGAFMVIDFKVGSQLSHYKKATEELKIKISEPSSTEEEKQKAKDEYKKRLADLIRMPKP